MIKFKLYSVVFFVFLFGILLSNIVSSLSVSPARTTLDFESNLEKEISFTVSGFNGEDTHLVLTTTGKLGEYIYDFPSEVDIKAGEDSKKISYKVKLPEKLEPDLNTGGISITIVPKEGSSEGSQILATIAVVSQLYVYVPIPGKHLNSLMKISNADEGEDIIFTFPISSKGTFDLTSVRAVVDIYNSQDKMIDSFTTPSISVPSGESKDLVYRWTANYPRGDYRAAAALIYDEGTLNFEEDFRIGDKELQLRDIYVSDFHLGEIVKLEILVENNWDKEINGAYIVANIYDGDGEVSNFESASHSVGAKSKYSFNSFWDTAGVLPGTYVADIGISYGNDGFSKESLIFEVSEDNLKIIGLGEVILSGGERDSDSLIIIIIVGIFFVLVNLLWFLWVRKKFKKRSRK